MLNVILCHLSLIYRFWNDIYCKHTISEKDSERFILMSIFIPNILGNVIYSLFPTPTSIPTHPEKGEKEKYAHRIYYAPRKFPKLQSVALVYYPLLA